MWRDSVEDSLKKKNFKKEDWINTKNNLKKSCKYFKNNKKELIMVIITSVLFMPMSILNPILSARMLLDLNGELYNDLLKVAAFIFVVYSVQAVLRFISNVIYEKFTIKITYAIQKEVMEEVFKLSSKCYDENGTGLFIDRLRSDTSSIVNVFHDLTNTIIDLLTNIGVFVVVFSISKIMLFFFFITGIKSIIFEKIRTTRYYNRHAVIRKIEEENTGLVSELIRGARDIKILNAKNTFMKKFDERINKANNKRIELTISDRRFWMIENIIDEIFDFLFFALGVFIVTKNYLLPANFVVLYMYRGRINYVFSYFSYMIDHIKSFNLSASRVFEIIDGTKFPKEKFGTKVLKKINGDFEFRDVFFAYKEEKEILHGISFSVHANETVAFVGRSGSGKTTVFSLLDKLYDVPDGHIFIDGEDINTLSKDSIRNNISYISQNPYIFNLSIRDNLLLVRENVTEKEIIKACKTAQLHDFIMSLPKGYDTMVGEGGVTLSGGERQRLAIARALIKKTEIILFDEATSALDNETQEKIATAIHNLKGKYTILIIAHRLSTVINSDKIFLIEKGKIIGTGTHNELLKNNKKYQKLYQADLLQEEKLN